MVYALRALYDPAMFQGPSRRSSYFEGWYFKAVAEDRSALAVIPGVSFDAAGTGHAFVQLIRDDGWTAYTRYPIEAFEYAPRGFDIAIGPNRFSTRGLSLDLTAADVIVKAELRFSDWEPWPVTTLSPGIMGWYRFVPKMECYHGVLSLDHDVEGVVQYDQSEVRFEGARGYVEKDWGTSFPAGWLWAQANDFDDRGTSITCSIAKIPWRGSHFVGYIAGLWHEGRLYRFTTYTGAKMTMLEMHQDGCNVRFEGRGQRLTCSFAGAEPGHLASPELGAMSGRVAETLTGGAEVLLERSHNGEWAEVFSGSSCCCGLELMDDDSVLAEGVVSA